MTGGVDENNPDIAKVKERSAKYTNVLKTLIHSPETRNDVVKTLKSNPDPFMTVPLLSNQINDMAKQQMKEGGVEVGHDVQLASSEFLIGDLLMLGEASGAFEMPSKEDMVEIFQDSMEMYIQKGLKNGSIDPIQLQLDAEKLLNDVEKDGGLMLADKTGVPRELSQAQITEQFGQQKKREALAEVADRDSKQKAMAMEQSQQGALQQQVRSA